MFDVGDIIVYSDGKVYKIVKLIEQENENGPQQYFELKQNEMYKDERNTSVFTPVSKVQTESRSLMSKQEALALIDEYPSIEPVWISDFKQRKIVFADLSKSQDPRASLKLIKSFIKRQDDLKDTNKSLTITDKKLLEKLQYNILIEVSYALNLSFDDTVAYIKKRLNK